MLANVIGLGLATILLVSAKSERPGAEADHWRRLDGWVASGGDPASQREEVVKSCEQLMIAAAGVPGRGNKESLRKYRDELEARVDVCVKLTVHRVRKQRGFDDPQIVSLMCDMNDRVFNQRCAKAGWRK